MQDDSSTENAETTIDATSDAPAARVKLLGTSQRQMETLARMRRGGEQVVKHVHVDNRGGQAVIAENVNQGVGTAKSEDQSLATGNSRGGSALLRHETQDDGVPIAGCRRQDALRK